MKEFSKSNLELLKDLLSKLIKAKEKNDYFLGLCGFINRHYSSDYHTLIRIIEKNEPTSWFHKNFISDGGYYWKEGEIDPRIKFIKKLIKKSS
tara:strand:+ start:304 stop:582 length:279 start_codon:yes stop_codon:yes gene_type:complete